MEEIYKKNNYPSIKRFTELLKEANEKHTKKQIKEFLSKQTVTQLHKPIQKIKRKLRFITANSLNESWQIDLLDYQKYSKVNRGFNFILIVVDIFSRQAYAQPIKKKTPEQVSTAFKKILKHAQPKSIYSDDGSEWKGVFKTLLKELQITVL